MNKLPIEKRVAILRSLTEGCSLRSTSRMAGVSINTVTKLLIDAGHACARYQHENIRNLNCQRLQLDEIWAFCYAKQKQVNDGLKAGKVDCAGDVWTWTAIDADSKLIVSFYVGDRDGRTAWWFVRDLASRLSNRVQITTDGLKAYVEAVSSNFPGGVDYAQLQKIYGPSGPHTTRQEARYSPPACIGCESKVVQGHPDEAEISTSYVERQNLTMRMRMRRFTRLTNAFSKKFDNHEYAVALHFFTYNFITIHKTLRMTPAMAAGVTRHKWSYEELVEMIDADIEARKQPQKTEFKTMEQIQAELSAEKPN